MYLAFLDGVMLKKMLIAGVNKLYENKELIDSLNVFPVPDGDTGTNMYLTAYALIKELAACESTDVCDIAGAASHGALRGARGNSGVILSQLFRGFAKGLAGKKTATTDDLANAFALSVEMVYKAVMKPKEGTILTVAKACAAKAAEMADETDDIEYFGKEIIERGYYVLAQTKEMLPVLKQANVVDAGGKGFMCILEGAYQSIFSDVDMEISLFSAEAGSAVETDFPASTVECDIEFGYCTEFIIDYNKDDSSAESSLKEFYNSIGDSLVLVMDDDIIKVHVHSNHPGLVIEKALNYGSLSDIKIDNMKFQHTSMINKAVKDTAFISVSAGEGLKLLFYDLGVDMVIEGGQTMNPSTDDILKAIGSVNAKNIIILPNNKNIILAANQAAHMSGSKKVFVIPSKTIPQGISAMLCYDSQKNAEDNAASMEQAVRQVKTGSITYAARDSVFGDMSIKEGDILGMLESEIKVVEGSVDDCALKLMEYIVSSDDELITLYYGNEIEEDDTEKLSDMLNKQYGKCDISFHNGGQPLYYYIISVE